MVNRVPTGELGAAFTIDLADLEEQDLIEIGMKKLEVKRLLRLAAEPPPTANVAQATSTQPSRAAGDGATEAAATKAPFE